MNRLLLILALAATFVLSACEAESASEKADREQVDSQQQVYAAAQPVPQFQYSLEREAATQIYAARNTNVTTWSVWRSDYGHVLGDCPSIGYPIPYDTSLTNPVQVTGRKGRSGVATVEQAEPNGLFSSKNSYATWVRCVVTEGGVSTITPVYIEGNVNVYPYPVLVDYASNRVRRADGAKPTVAIKSRGR
jgi:hypothetical protein